MKEKNILIGILVKNNIEGVAPVTIFNKEINPSYNQAGEYRFDLTGFDFSAIDSIYLFYADYIPHFIPLENKSLLGLAKALNAANLGLWYVYSSGGINYLATLDGIQAPEVLGLFLQSDPAPIALSAQVYPSDHHYIVLSTSDALFANYLSTSGFGIAKNGAPVLPDPNNIYSPERSKIYIGFVDPFLYGDVISLNYAKPDYDFKTTLFNPFAVITLEEDSLKPLASFSELPVENSIAAPSYPDSNRIAYFPLTEGAGNNANGGVGINGTLHNVLFQSDGVAFDGIANHYISVPNLVDVFPSVGSIETDITPNNINGNPRLFSKIIGGTNVQLFILSSNGALSMYGTTFPSLPPYAWVNGNRYKIVIAWDAILISIFINGVLYYSEFLQFNAQAVQIFQQLNGAARPLIIGGYDQNDGSYPATFDGIMHSFEIRNDVISVYKALADADNTPFVPTKYIDKIDPQAGKVVLAAGVGIEYGVIESSIVEFGNTYPYFMYYTAIRADGSTFIAVATANALDGVFTRHGMVLPDLIHTGVFVFNNHIYIVGGNSMYKSVDGFNFVNVATYSISIGAFAEITGGFGNFAPVIPMQLINGKYVMFVEGNETADTWAVYRVESDTADIEGSWTFVSKETSLKIGGMYGGSWVVLSDGLLKILYHYCPVDFGSNGSLPTQIAYATSPPNNANDWTIIEAPFMRIFANPFLGTNQSADPTFIFKNGKTYIYAELCNNPAVQQGEIRLWLLNELL
jgi:hypothetical protein